MMIDKGNEAKKAWKSSKMSKMCTTQGKKKSFKRTEFPSKRAILSSAKIRV